MAKALVLPGLTSLLTASKAASSAAVRRTSSIKSIISPYLHGHKKDVEGAKEITNRLFRRYSAIVGLLFLIGSFTPANGAVSDSYSAGMSEDYGAVSYDTAMISDSDGYLTKVNPQTTIGDRSGSSEMLEHTVASGDTLSTIAASYGLKTATVLWANNLTDKSKLKVGQKLMIPPVDGVAHSIKKGETIDKVAKEYGVTVASIQKQNNLISAALPSAGQSIFIPGGKPIADTDTAPNVRNTPARIGTSGRVDVASVSTSDIGAGGAILPSSDDKPTGDRPFIFPTHGQLTQGFHAGHYAFDIGNRSQPPIWAAGDGVVVKAVSGCPTVSYGCGGGYGNHVIIDHGNGLQTLYGHMEYILVKVGDHVTQGQVVGKMGRTGNVRGATGIHLHFEVRLNGKKMLPSNYY